MCICFTGVRLFPFVCSAIERWTHLNKCVFLFFFFFIRSQQGWQLLMDVPQVYTQEEGMFSLTCFVLFFLFLFFHYRLYISRLLYFSGPNSFDTIATPTSI